MPPTPALPPRPRRNTRRASPAPASSASPRDSRRSPGRAGASRARLRLSTESCNSVPDMKAPAEGTLRGIATFLATFGIGVATYIAIADSGGGSPVCIAGRHGCQTVGESSYSHLLGVNLSLTFLELFTIDAICQWCVASAVLMTLLFITNATRMLAYAGSRR